MGWSIFGTTDEIVTGPIGSLTTKTSKKSFYDDGFWCGACLKMNKKRTWIEKAQKWCPICNISNKVNTKIMD